MSNSSWSGSPYIREVPPNVKHSIAVVQTVAAYSGKPVTELPPLSDSVDPDALDKLMARGNVEVTFLYHDYKIKVRAGEEVILHPADEY